MEYQLIDSGDRRKLEKMGKYLISRPAMTAFWHPLLKKEWDCADAVFTREEKWIFKKPLTGWHVEIKGLKLLLKPTEFGHVGFFPEHTLLWKWFEDRVKNLNILNLFAYSGATSLFLAKEGANVCHVDASHPIVSWAKENAALNNVQNVRWIVDDVFKFLKKEARRRVFYDAIILDPPSFGRGSKKEVFKLERDVLDLLNGCKALLSKDPSFVVFTSHTPGFSPLVMKNLLRSVFGEGSLDAGEMIIASKILDLPSGTYARWICGN